MSRKKRKGCGCLSSIFILILIVAIFVGGFLFLINSPYTDLEVSASDEAFTSGSQKLQMNFDNITDLSFDNFFTEKVKGDKKNIVDITITNDEFTSFFMKANENSSLVDNFEIMFHDDNRFEIIIVISNDLNPELLSYSGINDVTYNLAVTIATMILPEKSIYVEGTFLYENDELFLTFDNLRLGKIKMPSKLLDYAQESLNNLFVDLMDSNPDTDIESITIGENALKIKGDLPQNIIISDNLFN